MIVSVQLDELPDEVLLQIFSHLPGEDLCRSALICRKFHELISGSAASSLWKTAAMRRTLGGRNEEFRWWSWIRTLNDQHRVNWPLAYAMGHGSVGVRQLNFSVGGDSSNHPLVSSPHRNHHQSSNGLGLIDDDSWESIGYMPHSQKIYLFKAGKSEFAVFDQHKNNGHETNWSYWGQTKTRSQAPLSEVPVLSFRCSKRKIQQTVKRNDSVQIAFITEHMASQMITQETDFAHLKRSQACCDQIHMAQVVPFLFNVIIANVYCKRKRQHYVQLFDSVSGKALPGRSAVVPEKVQILDVHRSFIALAFRNSRVGIIDLRSPPWGKAVRLLGDAGEAQEALLMANMDQTRRPILDVKVSDDGSVLMACGRDHTVRTWRISDGELVFCHRIGPKTLPRALTRPRASKDGDIRVHVAGSFTHTFTGWITNMNVTKHSLATKTVPRGILCLIDHGGLPGVVLAGDTDGAITAWDMREDETPPYPQQINTIGFHPEESFVHNLCVASDDGMRICVKGFSTVSEFRVFPGRRRLYEDELDMSESDEAEEEEVDMEDIRHLLSQRTQEAVLGSAMFNPLRSVLDYFYSGPQAESAPSN
eukprot:Clim_evm16s21 gene=Clim_evmTU16s21